jgi:hypothetical protein
MKKDDLIIVIIGILLLAGMLITIFFGGEKSLHGVGMFFNPPPETEETASCTFQILNITDHSTANCS